MIKCNKGDVSIAGPFDVCLSEAMTVILRLVINAKEHGIPVDDLREAITQTMNDMFAIAEEGSDDECGGLRS